MALLFLVDTNCHGPAHSDVDSGSPPAAAGSSIAWWVWAAAEIDAAIVPDTGSAEMWDAPGAAVAQAPRNPVEVALSEDAGDATALQETCRGLWLMRRFLPPIGNGDNFVDGARRLGVAFEVVRKGSVRVDPALDLGFAIEVESTTVRTKLAACTIQSASRERERYEVRIDCHAPTSAEATVGAALGGGFSVLGRRAGTTFWRAAFVRVKAKENATKALAEALGPSNPEDTVSPELAPAYERLTSPFERLNVWRYGGWGSDEVTALERAKRYDLLRAALRGPNPEGRALAALALQESRALTREDRHVVEILAKSSIAIDVAAEDDMLWREPSSKFFSRLRWPQRADVRY